MRERGGGTTQFFYQACSLTDDIENREDSLHASKIYMYFTWLYVYKYMEIYMYIYTSIPGLGQCKPKHAKLWKHTTLVFFFFFFFFRTKPIFIIFYSILKKFFFYKNSFLKKKMFSP